VKPRGAFKELLNTNEPLRTFAESDAFSGNESKLFEALVTEGLIKAAIGLVVEEAASGT